MSSWRNAEISDLTVDRWRICHRGEIAHATQQTAGDARGAPGAARDLGGAIEGQLDAHQTRPSGHDRLQFLRRIELKAKRYSEAVAQRRRDQPGAGRRRHERERGKVNSDGTRRRPLADDQVELKVLHRGIQNFFDRRRQAVDLVDEQHVARLQVG